MLHLEVQSEMVIKHAVCVHLDSSTEHINNFIKIRLCVHPYIHV